MNRRFLRITLIGLIAIVAISSLLSWVSAGVGGSKGASATDRSQPSSSMSDASKSGSAAGQSSQAEATFEAGACTTDGVTIVVAVATDAAKTSVVRCVHGTKLTGWQLLQVAKLSPEGTETYPVGFLCRLMGVPDVATQDCQDTPKSGEGSWSYFYASAAAEQKTQWMYSGVGAATRRPECGDYEGWVFSKSTDYDPNLSISVPPSPFVCASK